MKRKRPKIELTGHEDYLQYVQMRATLRAILSEAEADPYSDFAVCVQERIETECPFVVEGKDG